MLQVPSALAVAAGIEPGPVIVKAPLPAGALTLKPVQVVLAAGVAAKVSPAGRLSADAAETGTDVRASLVSVMVSVLVAPLTNDAGLKPSDALDDASAGQASPRAPRRAREAEAKKRLKKAV